MKLLKNGFLLALSALLAIASPHSLQAQNVDAAMLLHPPADSWPGYHGDYSGQRHSRLTQITPQNVAESESGLGFSDESAGRNQILSAAGRRRVVLHRAGQCLGGRRAFGPS